MLPNTGTNTADDTVIEILIESASRFIEQEVWPRRFYATTETHYFDLPRRSNGRTLFFNDYLLSATTLTNGDATVISATNLSYYPINQRASAPYYKVEILPSASISFLAASNGDTQRCITLVGSWGFSSSTPLDIEQACMEIVHNIYQHKEGQAGDVMTRITTGGVLIQPNGIPETARVILNRYPRELGV